MAPASAIQHSLEDLVNNFTPGGCYGIEWELDGDTLKHKNDYSPQWWIEGVKTKGLKGLYTTESAKHEFPVGQGFVGRVFKNQEVLFVDDLQKLDTEGMKDSMQFGHGMEFMRAGLAKEFNIQSAIFLPQPNCVLEIGSAAKVDSMPGYYAAYTSPTTPALANGASVGAEPDVASKAEPPQLLRSLVSDLTLTSCYGIEWAWNGELLKYRSHFNPQWRVEGVLKQGLKGLYTSESRGLSFAKGDGLVGEAFDKQAVIFARDLQSLRQDDIITSMQTGVTVPFLRRDIAENFGIHSAVFLPMPEGVLEVGSVEMMGSFEEFLSEKSRAAIAGKTQAADILSALTASAD